MCVPDFCVTSNLDLAYIYLCLSTTYPDPQLVLEFCLIDSLLLTWLVTQLSCLLSMPDLLDCYQLGLSDPASAHPAYC